MAMAEIPTYTELASIYGLQGVPWCCLRAHTTPPLVT